MYRMYKVNNYKKQFKNSFGKCVPRCYTINIQWVTVMDVLNLNSMIDYHCIRKTILSENGLSAYITKYLFYNIHGIKIMHFITINMTVQDEFIFAENITFEKLINCIKYNNIL